MMDLRLDAVYHLSCAVLYRIPPCNVSYTPGLAGVHVWFTGHYIQLPADGGPMAQFRFAADGQTWQGSAYVYLRPFAVVPVRRS
jgi:hypothetical protein